MKFLSKTELVASCFGERQKGERQIIVTFHMVKKNLAMIVSKSNYKKTKTKTKQNAGSYVYQILKTVYWTKSVDQTNSLLVLSGKYLPQCTVGDLCVVCTIHNFAYIKKGKKRKKTPIIYV